MAQKNTDLESINPALCDFDGQSCQDMRRLLTAVSVSREDGLNINHEIVDFKSDLFCSADLPQIMIRSNMLFFRKVDIADFRSDSHCGTLNINIMFEYGLSTSGAGEIPAIRNLISFKHRVFRC